MIRRRTVMLLGAVTLGLSPLAFVFLALILGAVWLEFHVNDTSSHTTLQFLMFTLSWIIHNKVNFIIYEPSQPLPSLLFLLLRLVSTLSEEQHWQRENGKFDQKLHKVIR